jgi:biotin--protein ligase
LAYCTKLNGAGNAQIRSYVEAGGTYVGFCAGAYYGSKTVEFNRNSVSGDEVYAERELSFFPGSAVGPVLAPYEANSKTGARIAKIKWIVNGESSAQIHQVYYNGGCYFSGAASHPNVQVLGYYANEGFEGLAAIIKCKIGNGKALLSGVHPEYSAQNIQEHVLNSLSQVDRNHFEINIMPRLCDGTHRDVFRHIIEQLL